MIFTGFKRKTNQLFFNKRISKLIESTDKSTTNTIKNIIIVLDDCKYEKIIVDELLKLFSVSENTIKVLVFQKKIKKNENLKNVITPKDFGWYGKIKSEKLKDILTNKYDLLINYSKVENLYCNLLLLHCKTDFKAGFAHLDNRFYDLTIQCKPDEIELFNKELKKYLTILNKV
jgi:hypothetical protein